MNLFGKELIKEISSNMNKHSDKSNEDKKCPMNHLIGHGTSIL